MCVIAVDFDGTISYDFDKAREALKKLKELGHTIVIWSSRNNRVQHKEKQAEVFSDMLLLLQLHKIPYDMVDNGDVGKFHAQVYIDDKCWRFEDNWDDIISKIY